MTRTPDAVRWYLSESRDRDLEFLDETHWVGAVIRPAEVSHKAIAPYAFSIQASAWAECGKNVISEKPVNKHRNMRLLIRQWH